MNGRAVVNNRVSHRLAVGLARAIGFISKDARIAISYKLQFVFQFSQVFFGVAVIHFIGKMLDTSNQSPLLKAYGADYFSFALVGLAVTSYLRVGLVTITNDIRQIMDQGTLEAMCAAPVGYEWLLIYASLWPFVFETIRVACYFLIGMIVFGLRLHNANWFSALVTMAVTMPIFLMLGTISCSILILVKKGDPINWIFSSASALLAGTMFPITVLPGWLRAIALCLPLTHSLEAMRKCLLAGASVQRVRWHLLALLLFLVILVPVSVLVNNMCMRSARRQGAFSTH
jgi:ABC-2 type transport system permease protein